MKRQLIICGLLIIFIGCNKETPESSEPSGPEAAVGDEKGVMDEVALMDQVSAELAVIDAKLGGIETQLDQRLAQIEARLMAVEQRAPVGKAAQPAVAQPAVAQPAVAQPAVAQPAAAQPAATQPAATQPAAAQPAAAQPAAAQPAAAPPASGQSSVAVPGGTEDKHAYVGPLQCAACHLIQFRSWAETTMAKAYKVLKPGERSDEKIKANLDPDKDYTQDATCLPCHVTGYAKKGGFKDVEATPYLAGVSCEMCHGPAGTYLEKELKKNEKYKKADLVAVGLVDTVTIKQCEGCHNNRSPFVGDDYVFDFEANKEKGTHQHYPLEFEH